MAKEITKPAAKAAAVDRAKAKPKAPAIKFKTEVTSEPAPTFIYGGVSYNEKLKSYQLDYKRPRSSIVTSYLVPEETVIMAGEGEAPDGYILTANPQFKTSPIDIILDDAVVTPDAISGTDSAGVPVYINRRLLPVNVRQVSVD